jgi:hypothetical protein
MEITIPRWAKDVKDENWLVLFWFTRNLTVCYPPYAEATRTGIRHENDKKKLVAQYHMLPTDLTTIVGQMGRLQKTIAEWPEVAKNFQLGLLTNESTRITLRTWKLSSKVTIKTQRAKDLVLYLSGCLNRNIMTDEPRTDFHINYAVSGRFRYTGKNEAEDNGWYVED